MDATTVAIITLGVTTLAPFVLRLVEQRHDRNRELMQRRRDALHLALDVIDHVYENVKWNGQDPVRPHQWDESQAREAWNKMLLYCAEPDDTVARFAAALALRDPNEQPIPLRTDAVAAFRAQVRKELGTRPATPTAVDRRWIATLPGSGAERVERDRGHVF